MICVLIERPNGTTFEQKVALNGKSVKDALTYAKITPVKDAQKELLSGSADDILRPVDIQVPDTITLELIAGTDTDNMKLADLIGEGYLIITTINNEED